MDNAFNSYITPRPSQLTMKVPTSLLPILCLTRAGVAVLRRYSLTVTHGIAAPDGFSRPVFLINGQTPGPSLTADEGDAVEVTVVNEVTTPFTVHFHGVEMKETIWNDGVPGVTQRLIEAGESFTHRFEAAQHGLYWYHAHTRSLFGDGIRGTFYIRPNLRHLSNAPFSLISGVLSDIAAMQKAHLSPKVLSVSDWMHIDSETDIQNWHKTRMETLCVTSILLNGKGREICPPQEAFTPYLNPAVPVVTARGCAYPNNTFLNPFPDARPDLADQETWYNCKNSTSHLSVIEVERSEEWASLAFVNTGALWDLKVSIDSHPFHVYSADGHYHHPQRTDAILIPSGDRYQVMIRLDQDEGDYAIRIAAVSLPQVISGYGVLSYKRTPTTGTIIPDAKNPAINYGARLLPGKVELAPMTLQPFPATTKPPQNATVTLQFKLNRRDAVTWTLNNVPLHPALEHERPLLLAPETAALRDPDLVPSYPAGSVVDVVLISLPPNPAHPIHKHGVKAWIVGQGYGDWTWSTVSEAITARPDAFNLINPPYRDGFHTLETPDLASFTVIRFRAEEAGPILLHCHINLHLFGGMGVVLMQGPDQFPKVPKYYLDWNDVPHS